MSKMKLLFILGGQSTEHKISRMSATSIFQRLNREKYDITAVGINLDGTWHVLNSNITDFRQDNWLNDSVIVKDVFSLIKSFDVVFPTLHGLYGEDGTIQGLFELCKVPYVGCRVLDSSVSMDKAFTKKLLSVAGIKQVPSLYVKKRFDGKFVVVNDDTSENYNVEQCVSESLGFPCFVKASRSGSSVGCYKVSDVSKLMSKIEQAAQYDYKIIIEKAINCIELECAILGNDDPKASLVGEILPAGEFYTFESKYEDENSDTLIPARISEEMTQYIRDTAIKVFKAVDGHGLARVDFFLDKDTNEIYLNELNTLPGFTHISMYPKLWEATGIEYSELLDRVIELALER